MKRKKRHTITGTTPRKVQTFIFIRNEIFKLRFKNRLLTLYFQSTYSVTRKKKKTVNSPAALCRCARHTFRTIVRFFSTNSVLFFIRTQTACESSQRNSAQLLLVSVNYYTYMRRVFSYNIDVRCSQSPEVPRKSARTTLVLFLLTCRSNREFSFIRRRLSRS